MTVNNLGNIEITDAQIRSALLNASMFANSPTRADAAGNAVFVDGMLDQWRGCWDSMALETLQTRTEGRWAPDAEMRADAQEYYERAYEEGRIDALPTGSAGFLRDFDYIHREILEEARPQLNAGSLFGTSTEVPLGAATHTVRRARSAGKARWHQKGESFPLAKASYLEETFRTGFVVCAVEQSFFEGLQVGFAGLQTYRIEADAAIRAIEEFVNDVAFYGDPNRQIYGVLTYPHMPKFVLPDWQGLSGEAIAAQLFRIVDTPMISSAGIFKPNRLVVPEAVDRFLSTTMLNATAGTTTIKQFFLAGQNPDSGITRIEVAHELSATEMTAKGVGNPANYHGILAFRDDRRSLAHVMPQIPTFLPIWRSSPIDTLHVAFASTGGVTMHDGNNILGFIRLPR